MFWFTVPGLSIYLCLEPGAQDGGGWQSVMGELEGIGVGRRTGS